MRSVLAILAVVLLGCQTSVPDRDSTASSNSDARQVVSNSRIPEHSPELAARADSLARLDPEVEAHAAIARGDLRFIAVCGYACMPSGVPLDSAMRTRDSLALRDSLRSIPGTSDAIFNQDVARLNTEAHEYATRYNRIIWAHRVALRRSRPVT